MLKAELDAADVATFEEPVFVEEVDIVETPGLDKTAVGKLLVVEDDTDRDGESIDDTLVCELLMELEVDCDAIPESAVEADMMLVAYDIAEFIEDVEELLIITKDEVGDPEVEITVEEVEDKLLGDETSRAACTFEFGLIAPIEDFS